MKPWPVAVLLLAATVWAGCVGKSADDPITFGAPGLGSATTATYDVVWDDGQEFLLSLEMKPAQIAGPTTATLSGYDVRLHRTPPFSPESGSQDELLAPFGSRLPVKFGLDECLAPLWGAVRQSENLLAEYDTFPTWLPPIFYAAGRTFEKPADFSYTPEAGGNLDFSKAFEVVGRSWSFVITYADEATLYAQTVPPGGLTVIHHPRQWFLEYDDDAALPAVVRAYGPEGTGTLRLRDWKTSDDPLPVCEKVESQRWDTAIERLPLTARATSQDPPLPYLLNAAIHAAEADGDLSRLRSFLETHPDAYLASWSYAQNRRIRQESPAAWTLGYAAPGFHGTLDVTCVFRVAPLQSPTLEPQSDCSVAPEPAGDEVGVQHNWSALSTVRYDAWLDYFASTFDHRPEYVTYRISADHNMTGTIRWIEESDEESAAPDLVPSYHFRTIHYDARNGVANWLASPEGVPFCSETPCDI